MKAIQFNYLERIPGTRLSYLEEAPRVDPKRRRAKFICDCGTSIETDLNWVRFHNITSCGCYKSDILTAKNTKHSQAKRNKATGAYRSWQAMHHRVIVNPLYSLRPICDRWCGENGFKNFYADMGDRPEGLTLERTDNNKGYEPGNCIWADMTTQNLNKSNSRKNKP